eukprot:scaffold26986_cov78-Isochrysis_galbana.AAC.1
MALPSLPALLARKTARTPMCPPPNPEAQDGSKTTELGAARLSLEQLLDGGADLATTKLPVLDSNRQTIGHVVASVAALAPLREIEAEIEAGGAAGGGVAVARPMAAQQSATRERAREEAGVAARRQLTVGVGTVRLLGRAARQRHEWVRVEVEVMGVQVRRVRGACGRPPRWPSHSWPGAMRFRF